jgi:ribosomal protein S18 acetylase RimI-like enzyme
MSNGELRIRQMTRNELDVLVDWAAEEGWNPGLDDAEVFWATDPEGFIAAELDGEMIGGGSIVSYGGRYGFMGFFIVRPEFRGRGLGDRLWQWRKRRLLDRLDEPKVIGMDGVFAMQAYYAKGGFELAGRDLRFEGKGAAAALPAGVVELSEVPFAVVDAYDRRHFPAPRPRFLERWIARPGGHAVGVLGGDDLAGASLAGYGVLRPCRMGHKIGPLFAADAEAAERLFVALSRRVSGQPIYLDVPETNPAAVALARRHGMSEVFGCAKMYLGPRPALPEAEIFGVTTFELG